MTNCIIICENDKNLEFVISKIVFKIIGKAFSQLLKKSKRNYSTGEITIPKHVVNRLIRNITLEFESLNENEKKMIENYTKEILKEIWNYVEKE